jgi:hypothetical protein
MGECDEEKERTWGLINLDQKKKKKDKKSIVS